MKLRLADFYTIQTDKDTIRCWYEPDIPLYEVRVNLTFADGAMRLTVYGEETPLKHISLRWNFTEEEKRTDFPRILGDAYERAYGDLTGRGIEPERIMPWYMLVSDYLAVRWPRHYDACGHPVRRRRCDSRRSDAECVRYCIRRIPGRLRL